jgi:hypothetical protein
VPSDKAAFRLLAVDLFDLAEPIDNIAAHPKNRIQAGGGGGGGGGHDDGVRLDGDCLDRVVQFCLVFG